MIIISAINGFKTPEAVSNRLNKVKTKYASKVSGVIELDASQSDVTDRINKLSTLCYKQFGSKEDAEEMNLSVMGVLLIINNYGALTKLEDRIKVVDTISVFEKNAGCVAVVVDDNDNYNYYDEFPEERDTGAIGFTDKNLKEAFISGYRLGKSLR